MSAVLARQNVATLCADPRSGSLGMAVAIGAHVKHSSRPLTGPQRSQPRIVNVPNHRHRPSL
jgi:hypothetical protein